MLVRDSFTQAKTLTTKYKLYKTTSISCFYRLKFLIYVELHYLATITLSYVLYFYLWENDPCCWPQGCSILQGYKEGPIKQRSKY